jgi:hypothetical protein
VIGDEHACLQGKGRHPHRSAAHACRRRGLRRTCVLSRLEARRVVLVFFQQGITEEDGRVRPIRRTFLPPRPPCLDGRNTRHALVINRHTYQCFSPSAHVSTILTDARSTSKP